MLAIALSLGLGLGLGLHHHAAAAPGPEPAPATSSSSVANIVQPAVGSTWEYPLGYTLTAGTASSSYHFYSVDLVNTEQSDIEAIKAAGHIVACYFSAGSKENYRDDAGQFPSEAVGKVMDGWPDENWVDTRNAEVRDIMTKRIADAKSKSCDGIDADNIDGYTNDTGFDLSEADGVDYVKFLAKAAHDQGLAYGLKNGGDMVDSVVGDAEWVINEQCVQYDECDVYKPFTDAGKPVFHVEYTDDDDATTVDPTFKKNACAAGGQTGFSTIIKHESLDNWTVAC
ncbi:MAG: hypothetical protein MMC23_000783 [Stictis urceolatum]|nr:hypothetical protein [Stictis urceolata]